MTPIYYRDAAAAICVFDVTSRLSLDAADKWIADLRQYAPAHTVLALAGNKCDMHGQEEVSLENCHSFQQKHDIETFQQTSAKEGQGIEELFVRVALKIDQNREKMREAAPSIVKRSGASLASGKNGNRKVSGKCKC